MVQALGLYRAGPFAEAESRCRQILAVEPDNADSLHLQCARPASFLPGEKGKSEFKRGPGVGRPPFLARGNVARHAPWQS